MSKKKEITESYRFTIVNGNPPVWEEANKKFDLSNHKPIFAYGDVIYNPHGIRIPEDLLRHEAVHMKQQGGTQLGAKLWWIRYLGDVEFMVTQEVEAYHEQYRFMCTRVKDRNQQFRFLHSLAEHLASEMYGNPISQREALQRIKTFSKKIL